MNIAESFNVFMKVYNKLLRKIERNLMTCSKSGELDWSRNFSIKNCTCISL